MSGEPITLEPLAAEGFGSAVTIKAETPDGAIQLALDAADRLRETFDLAGGLMVIRGLDALVTRPEAFLDIARIFGPEVENVRETLTAPRFFHPDLPEIMRLANVPPCRHPPPRRAPAAPDGGFEVRHPHQTNWHTDQSYRRPPPDVTLLLAVTTPPADQGQTLYADCSRALAALPDARREAVSRLTGIHAAGWTGRRREDARAGVPPKPLLPHQVAQCHPLVRHHPATGRPALYFCAGSQMDYADGPIKELEPGPDGAGARLIEELMEHCTSPRFVYTHRWSPGDLVVGDNRCLLHAATWYDADVHAREMWRITVMGNPGEHYAGESKSWIPAEGFGLMEGMDDA